MADTPNTPQNITPGERVMGVVFESGNNSTEQNTREAYAHMYNRVEKLKTYHRNGEETTDADALKLIRLSQTTLEVSCDLAVRAIQKLR